MEKSIIANKLKELGIQFENLPKPGGSYVAVNIRGNIAYVAIQFAIKDNQFYYIGQLGKEVTTEEGYQATRQPAWPLLMC